ncbi:MAG: hypothetical protein IPG50_20355 [Myxococcales bacterium]|nr:hypothetical protein [Myxococcales bacterium]
MSGYADGVDASTTGVLGVGGVGGVGGDSTCGVVFSPVASSLHAKSPRTMTATNDNERGAMSFIGLF